MEHKVSIMRGVRAVAATLAMTPSPLAFAQPIIIADSGDSAWVLTATMIVLLMAIPGLGLFYGGLVRSRNLSAALVSGIIITSLVSLIWAVAGYSLTFGEGSAWLGGLGNLGLANLVEVRDGTTISEILFVLLQMTFALFTSALILTAVADRVRLGWVVGFTVLWSSLVYVPITRWVWGGGWLAERGTLDFAGGIVVHTTAGVAALVIALLLGKRKSVAEPIMANSSAVAVGGAGLLWIGSLGLTGGSSFAAGADAATAIVNTHLAACAAALVWTLVRRVKNAQSTSVDAVIGAVAGLATIAPAAGFVGPVGAILLGILGSIGAYAALSVVNRSVRIDGSLHVFAVHGAGGIIGSLAFPVFVLPAFGGPGYDEAITLGDQFAAQAVGVGVAVLWTAIVTAIVALMVAMVIPMRANEELNSDGNTERA